MSSETQDTKNVPFDSDSNLACSTGYLLFLSKEEARCVRALKKLQFKYAAVNSEFHKELHLLECKYLKLYEGFFKKRSEIVNGEYKPTDEECDFDAGEVINDAESEERKFDNGVENFWLNVMLNSSLLNEYIQDYDRPILKHLKDIQLIMSDDPMWFQLKFFFGPNEFFTNDVLTKTYFLKIEVPETQPAAFQGVEFERCEGTVINWNEGKNPSVTVIKKRQKHKTRGIVRTLMKTLERNSFFNFFKSVEDSEDLGESERYLLQCDYDIGHYIKERIIPFATEYFTGEISDDEDDDDDDIELEEGDECECSDSNDDVDGVVKNETASDCKQQ